MPQIKNGETRQKFTSRAIKEFIKKGLSRKEAIGRTSSLLRRKRKSIPGIGVSKNLKLIQIGKTRSIDQKLFKRVALLRAMKNRKNK